MICTACQGDVPVGARFCPACATPAPPAAGGDVDPLRQALEDSLGFQYRIERLLGRGGMGAVYLARELALDREVAIKVLRPERVDSSEARERFRREARTAAPFSHPNIVPLYTFGEVKGIVYFVMGYVPGESLRGRLGRRGRLPPSEARGILVEVADALAYAHGLGVVHRDIKPDNILVDASSGRAMLTDFGVAKAPARGGSLTAAGLVVGTPHYMSPEQAGGRTDLDGRSDIYSLGVMAYAMLAGRLPFEGETPGDILAQHMTKDPPPLLVVAPHVPATLAATVMRCLTKDPAQRWPHAAALRDALSPSESTQDRPASVRNVAALIQVLVALVLLGGYIRIYLGDNPDGFLRDPVNTMTFFAALGTILFAVLAKRRLRVPWLSLLRLVSLQPAWWPGWYPPPLRHPGDLWDRLPSVVRAARSAVSAMLLSGALFVVPFLLLLAAINTQYERTGRRPRLLAPLAESEWLALILVAMNAVGFVGLAAAMLWLRRHLGGEVDWGEGLLSATWKRDSPWRTKPFQVLLVPERGAELDASSRTVEELAAEVRRLVARLPAARADLSKRCGAVARSLVKSIAAIDQEMADLELEADPIESERLAQKVAALGAPAEGEPASRREMRDLLTRQLSLTQALATRIDQARRNRDTLVERLRSLWQHLSLLQGNESMHLQPSAPALESLRILCAHLERPADADTLTVPAGRGNQPTRDAKGS